jgi:hypothetical protein
MLRRIAAADAKARSYGIVSERGIGQFAALGFIAGPDFDERPKVRRYLTHPGIEPHHKIQSVAERSFSGGTRARNALRWPGCPPRFRREGGAGGLRFRPIGSEEGGLEELVELSWSRAWRSRTVASSAAIRS